MKFVQHIINSFQSSEKTLVFINFKPVKAAYGGGNQFVDNLYTYLSKFDTIKITYKLKRNINIYLIIDIRKGKYKAYTFDQIYAHKIENKKGTIICRINDCDITREIKIREKTILDNIKKIDHFVFNSLFIKSYYFNKYPAFNAAKNSVIFNTANPKYFYPTNNGRLASSKIKIVTHHWSDNINKGYKFYYELFKYCKTQENIEFVFIGRKFNDNYIFDSNNVPITGPFKDKELGEKLQECDLYISASIYDAGPMHVFEALACGLPILYIEHEGGGKDICELAAEKVGEAFLDFEDLIQKMQLIIDNYDTYTNNIHKNIHLYNSDLCYSKFYDLIMELSNS
jgi:glycosyltransferase involved in cell wall biosynthesis